MVVIKTKTRRMIPGATTKKYGCLFRVGYHFKLITVHGGFSQKKSSFSSSSSSPPVWRANWSPKAAMQKGNNCPGHRGAKKQRNTPWCWKYPEFKKIMYVHIDIQTIIYIYMAYIFINLDKQHLPKGAIFFGSIFLASLNWKVQV